MRTSSMKSRTAVATLVITLAVAAPQLNAKPAQAQPGRSAITVVKQLVLRYLGIKTTGDLPSDPTPLDAEKELLRTKRW